MIRKFENFDRIFQICQYFLLVFFMIKNFYNLRKIKVLQLVIKKYLLARYEQFASECYDDGFNKRLRGVREGTNVNFPVTNEEGARHKGIKVFQKQLYFYNEEKYSFIKITI